MEGFPERLREAMEIRNFRQRDLVRSTNINKGAISNYLSGKYRPNGTNTLLIARALNVNVLWLMGYDVPMETNDHVEYTPSPEEDGSYVTYEWKDGFETEITKEKWTEFYDKVMKLPENMKLDVFKYVVLAVSMIDFQEKMKR